MTAGGRFVEGLTGEFGGFLGVQVVVENTHEAIDHRILQFYCRSRRIQRQIVVPCIGREQSLIVVLEPRHGRHDLMARPRDAPGRSLTAEAGRGARRQVGLVVGDRQPVVAQARIEHRRSGVDARVSAVAVARREDDQDVIVEHRLVEVAIVAARAENLTHQRRRRIVGQAVPRTPTVVDDPHLARRGQVDDVGLGRADDVAVDEDVAEPQEVAGGEVGRGRIDVGAEGVAEHGLAVDAGAADGAGDVGAVAFPAATRVDAAVVAVVARNDRVQTLDLAFPAEQRVIHVDACVIDADRQPLARQAQGVGVLQPQIGLGVVDRELSVFAPGCQRRVVIRSARPVRHVEPARRRRDTRLSGNITRPNQGGTSGCNQEASLERVNHRSPQERQWLFEERPPPSRQPLDRRSTRPSPHHLRRKPPPTVNHGTKIIRQNAHQPKWSRLSVSKLEFRSTPRPS